MSEPVKRVKTGGRKKGTPNKVRKTTLESLQNVYQQIGGDEAFADFANENPTEFYKIWSKVLPKEIHTNLEHEGSITISWEK